MPIYLIGRLLRSVADTFRHWYADGFRFFAGSAMNLLKVLDRTLSVRVNVENIFKPLYQDNSFLGYFFGFFLRLFKIISGVVIYALIFAVAGSLYVAWALAPFFILIKITGIHV